MTNFLRPAFNRGFMLRAFLLPALLLIPSVSSGINGRITMASTSCLRAESAMYLPTNAMQNTGASSSRGAYVYYTSTTDRKSGNAYSYEDAVEGLLPSSANAFASVNTAGMSICPSRKDHRIEFVSTDMYPTPQQEDNSNRYSVYSGYDNYSDYSNYSGYRDFSGHSGYAAYSPALTMVGANGVAPIASTTGNTPYSNSPSRAPSITNIQRGIFDNGFGYEDDINRDPESPVGEAWSLLFLAAGYGLYLLVRRKKEQQIVEKG